MDFKSIADRCKAARRSVEQAKGELKQIKEAISKASENIDIHELDLKHTQKAQIIAQIVAQETQSQLEVRLNKLVSIALESVFEEEAYKMKFQIEINRGKTVVKPFFERDGKLRRPGFSTGFGPCDVASFALRPTLWALEDSRKRPVFIFDECSRHLNDPTLELNTRFAEAMHDISEKLGVQIIIITQDDSLCTAADKVFQVKKIGKESHIFVKDN